MDTRSDPDAAAFDAPPAGQRAVGGGTVARGAPARAAESLQGLPPARQRRVLVDMLRAGHTDRDIARIFALTQWQIRNLRYRLGIKRDRDGSVRVAESTMPLPALERELVAAAAVVHGLAPHAAAAPEPAAPVEPDGDAGRTAPAADRMGVRLDANLDGAEAGRRLSAIGGLLAASNGQFSIHVNVRQVGPPAWPCGDEGAEA